MNSETRHATQHYLGLVLLTLLLNGVVWWYAWGEWHCAPISYSYGSSCTGSLASCTGSLGVFGQFFIVAGTGGGSP